MAIPPFDLSVQLAELGEELDQAVLQVLRSGQYIGGPVIASFEEAFAAACDVPYAIGCNSGTDALVLALRALDVGVGDEVITSSFSFFATAEAISAVGATPVFVDVNPSTYLIDLDQVEAAITSATKALLPVHLFSRPVDMERLMQLANRHNLLVVEDCAQATGASWAGRAVGSWGDAGCFSFFPTKNLGAAGDGGAVTCRDGALAQRVRELAVHGMPKRYLHTNLGYNSRLDTFQAVVGNWLLPQAKQISDLRINNARYLDEKLKLVKGITIPNRPTDMRVVFHLYSVFAKNRDELLKHCIAKGIEAKVHYPVPIYRQQALARISGGLRFPVSDRLAADSISFPCDQHLEIDQLDEIISTVTEFYEN